MMEARERSTFCVALCVVLIAIRPYGCFSGRNIFRSRCILFLWCKFSEAASSFVAEALGVLCGGCLRDSSIFNVSFRISDSLSGF